jgi:hypothetical protein
MRKDGGAPKKATSKTVKTYTQSGTGRATRYKATGTTATVKTESKNYSKQPSGTVLGVGTGRAKRYGAVKK